MAIKKFCPHKRNSVHLRYKHLKKRECPACKTPLVPDHMTQKELDSAIAQSENGIVKRVKRRFGMGDR
jgi:hypothetical protein